MKTEVCEYKDGDVALRGYLAYDDAKAGKRPRIIVMPETFGLGAQAKRRAEMLAGLGYVALAGDPYGDGVEVTNLQEAINRAGAIFADPAKARQRVRAALDRLASVAQVDTSRMASMGYCMGGGLSLEARALESAGAAAWCRTADWRGSFLRRRAGEGQGAGVHWRR